MHDIPGLMQLMGGKENYNARLDQHFSGGHNEHSNEPSHHYGYLYDYSGQPWKTQEKVREIAAAEYMNEPTLASMGGAPKGYDAAAFARDVKVFAPYLKKASPQTIFLGPGGVVAS